MKLLAAGFEKAGAAFHRQFFQGFQAVGGEARSDHVDASHAVAAERCQRLVGVGLQPFGAAEARLEGEAILLRVESQRLRQQAPGLPAFAMVGVALVERVAWHAVETHQQYVGAAVHLPVIADVGGQRLDVGGVVVVVLERAQRRLVADLLQPGKRHVECGGGAGGGVLRIGGQDQDAVAAGGLHSRQGVGDGRVAVAHRVFDHERGGDFLAQPAFQQLGLLFGVDLERRAVLGPDRGVFRGRLFRSGVEDDAVEDRPPHGARDFHHARVGQELLQVRPQRPGGRRLGGAEIDQQDAGAGGLVMGVFGFLEIAHQ